MIHLLFFFICFGASVAGAICGIGGGVIIKPVLDAFGVLDVAAISFLSGCTVLAMSTYSVIKSKLSGVSRIEGRVGIPLAAGAVLGGIVGKSLFELLKSQSSDSNSVGAVQAVCLMLVTIGTLVYTVWKHKIKTHCITSIWACIGIGLLLGILSSFLGIGGGPINLVVLFFFFSMDTKTAAENSLYIICFSQTASFLQAVLTGTVPEFSPAILVVMAAGGILGGIFGRSLNKKIPESMVDHLFIGLMTVIIGISFYNFISFLSGIHT